MGAPTTERPLAVVTGASRGIGCELAEQFAGHGYDVPIAAEIAEQGFTALMRATTTSWRGRSRTRSRRSRARSCRTRRRPGRTARWPNPARRRDAMHVLVSTEPAG